MMDLGNDGHKEVVRMEFNKANTACLHYFRCCWSVSSSLPLGGSSFPVRGALLPKLSALPMGRNRGLSGTEVEDRQIAGCGHK